MSHVLVVMLPSFRQKHVNLCVSCVMYMEIIHAKCLKTRYEACAKVSQAYSYMKYEHMSDARI